ncbi:MAG TPA: hypothetical protein VKD71_01275, partial [Gemmataceae bacterium]|nr:hypothetical protein [Gemmataceae bacterium]
GSEERAQVLARTPEAVVTFLKNNRKLPSRYKIGTRDLNNRLKQFPVLPDVNPQVTTQELSYKDPFPDHEQDAFLAARAWYALANTSLPPASGSPATMGTDNPDPLKYRIPKRPATIIFRQGPMRAQTYYAEHLTKEGWFDSDPWIIDDLIDEDRTWIPKTDADGKRVQVLLKSPASAQEAWKEAARRWLEHGTANGLRMDAAQLERYRADAEEYCQLHPGKLVGELPDPLSPQEAEDDKSQALHYAMRVMNGWIANRFMTNFETFELESDGMRTDDAILAKKRFYQADRAVRDAAEYSKAVKLYDEGFAAWKRVLVEKQDCRRSRASDPTRAKQPCRDFRDIDRLQEEVYDLSMRYVKLSQDVRTVDLRAATVAVHDLLRYASAGPSGNMLHGLGNLAVWYPLEPKLKAIPPFPLPGPMDGLAPDGSPWINDDNKFRVREKLGLIRRSPTAPMVTPPAMLGPPGGGPPAPGGE